MEKLFLILLEIIRRLGLPDAEYQRMVGLLREFETDSINAGSGHTAVVPAAGEVTPATVSVPAGPDGGFDYGKLADEILRRQSGSTAAAPVTTPGGMTVGSSDPIAPPAPVEPTAPTPGGAGSVFAGWGGATGSPDPAAPPVS